MLKPVNIRRAWIVLLIILITATNTGCSNFSRGNQPSVSPEIQRWVDQTLAGMSLEEKVGQLIVTGVDGTSIDEANCLHVQSIKTGGITFQTQNIIDPVQMRAFHHWVAGMLDNPWILSPRS